MALVVAACETARPQGDARPSERRVETPAEPTTAAEKAPSPAPVVVKKPAPRRPVTVAFVGDINLDLVVGHFLRKRAAGEAVPPRINERFPFDGVAERLVAADYLVGNLECVASEIGPLSTDHNPFRCPLNGLAILKKAGFDLVSVANNHAFDFGPVGFRDMLKNLDAAGMPHFGKENFEAGKPQPAHVATVEGLTIGLLTYYLLPKKPLVDVRRTRKDVDVLIVFLHWGREDQPSPLPLQRRLAHDFIDAGVDVVVGTHAHVMQPIEWYRGKLIAYGLGNFVFAGMTHTPLHRQGGILEIELDDDGPVGHRMLEVTIDADGAPHWARPPSEAPLLKPATPVEGGFPAVVSQVPGRLPSGG